VSERTTRAQLDALARHVSSLLPAATRVVSEGRYGYTALDVERESDGNWSPTRSLTSGTKSEVYRYLRGMLEALWLADLTEAEL